MEILRYAAFSSDPAGGNPAGVVLDATGMTAAQMLELFSLEGIQKTPGRFDRKKLAWMNGEYIRAATPDRLLEALASFNAVTDYPIKNASQEMQRELIAIYQERMVTLVEMAENSRFFFEEPVYDPKAVDKVRQNNNGLMLLQQCRALLTPDSD